MKLWTLIEIKIKLLLLKLRGENLQNSKVYLKD